ncbi:MAG: RraA family protein [Clostridiales bacterium]|nr:RraA family protein [Clostridiales bacterium]
MFSKDIIERYSKLATASVADAADKVVGRTCYMSHEIKPRINDTKVVGPAITVHEGPTDETLPPTHALEAIDSANEGDVMVIALDGSDKDVAVWGGLMTAGSVANKLAGAILDAGTRDVTEIRRDFDFQVFSRSVSPGTTLGRYKTLASNVPVICGGIEVNPGDLIVADLDGVVVVPKDHVEEVLEIAEEIEAKEAEQAKYILETGSLLKGIDKYNRI